MLPDERITRLLANPGTFDYLIGLVVGVLLLWIAFPGSTKADLETFEALTLLVGYNLLYALPFASVPIMVALMGDGSRPLLERINQGLERMSAFLMPVILGLAGLALVVDALMYFTTGRELF